MAIDRDIIDINDSGVEIPLVSPGWTVTNMRSKDSSVSLASLDKIN